MKPVENQKAGVRQENPARVGHIKRDKTKMKERGTVTYIKDMPEIKPAIPDTGV